MSLRQAAIATVGVLSVLVGAYLLWRILAVVLLLFLGILVASAIEPLVQRLRRGPFSRGTGVLAIYTAMVGVIALAALVTIPALLQQVAAFSESLPTLLADVQARATALGPRPVRDAALAGVGWARSVASGGGATADSATVVDAGLTVVHLVVALVTTFVLGYYWLMERPTLKRLVLQLSGPRHARRVNLVWVAVEARLGAWVRGQLLLMGVVGVGLGAGYAVLGLPGVLPLALWAALAEMIPMVGPYLGVAPALLVALTVSPTTALLLLVYAVLIQSLEGYVLVPRVMGRAVGVSPLVVFLGILIGSELDGLTGAFLAVPVAGALQVVLQDLVLPEHEVATQALEAGVADLPPDEVSPGVIHDHDAPVLGSHAHPVLPGGVVSTARGPRPSGDAS